MKLLYISRIRYLILVLFFFQIQVRAQLLTNEGYYAVPEILSTYCKASTLSKIMEGEIDIKGLKQKKGELWIVYSDRENNTLYHAPGGVKKNTVLKYLEPLVVKEIDGNWIHVYSRIDENNNQDVDRGWIKGTNLILSSYATLNEKSIPKKAMALVSLDNAKDELSKLEIEKYKLFYAPNNDNKKGEATKFEIYYVLKEVPGMKLLSRTDKLSGSQTSLQANVAGWMSNFHITNWDSRLCLEISSKTDAKQAYGENEIPIYPTLDKLNTFIAEGISNTDGAIMRLKVRNAIPDPYVMRMPILNNIDDAYKKQVATVGSLGKSTDQAGAAKIMRRLQEAKNKLENVNIVFVIDGTASMKEYYKPVANSIKKIIQNNSLQGVNNKLRFGLVIYRDYADGTSKLEVEKITPDADKIIEKVLTTQCFSADKDLPEAQYNGLISGLQMVGLNKDQSNITVLIGDAGNHNPDPQGLILNQVCNTLKGYEASLVTFQVVNGKDQSYTDFNFDAQDMLLKTGAMYTKNPKSVKLNDVDIKNTYKLNFTSSSNTSKDIPDLFMFGRFTYASGNQAMSTAILEKNITNSTREYINWVENIVAICENLKTGNTEAYSEDILQYLRIKIGLSEDDIKKLKAIKEFSFVGYTSNRFYNKEFDCYLPVVFLSQDELSILVKSFQNFRFENQSTVQKKDNLKRALLDQTMKMLGEVSEDNIINKSLDEIWNIILAVPFDRKGKYGNLSKVKLRDLNKVSDKVFDNFINDFEIKIRDFKVDRFRDYSFESGNQIFYWVPLSRFPGND
jgi:hypothetical protein